MKNVRSVGKIVRIIFLYLFGYFTQDVIIGVRNVQGGK